MTDFDEVPAFEITLEEDDAGQGRVRVKLHAADVCLSSHQARVFATELIMAASRAEVRENLKRGDGKVRKETQINKTSRRFFEQSFAK